MPWAAMLSLMPTLRKQTSSNVEAARAQAVAASLKRDPEASLADLARSLGDEARHVLVTELVAAYGGAGSGSPQRASKAPNKPVPRRKTSSSEPKSKRAQTAADSVQKELAKRLELFALADKVGVVEAMRRFGMSRSTFYRSKAAYDDGGEEGLRKMIMRASAREGKTAEQVEKAVLAVTRKNPTWGRIRVLKALQAEGFVVSSTRVWSVWKQHGLLKGRPS